MENFLNTLKINWYYTQKAFEMIQGKWYWTAAILIDIGCAIYVAVKKPLLLPLIAWGPFTSVVINNALYLKLLKHMEELEYIQCTAFALVAAILALALLFGVGSGVTGVVVIIM